MPSAALIQERREAGLCTKCGRPRDSEKFATCSRCRRKKPAASVPVRGDDLSEASWARARAVLLGDDPENGVSLKAAAYAAGLDVQALKRWIHRSRERRPEDPPWVHEIAIVFGSSRASQGQTLEDEAFRRAAVGTTEPVFYLGKVVGHKTRHDNKLLMTLLRHRDDSYREDAHLRRDDGEGMTIEEMFERFGRMRTVEEARKHYRELAEEQGLMPGQKTIEGTAREVEPQTRGKRLGVMADEAEAG